MAEKKVVYSLEFKTNGDKVLKDTNKEVDKLDKNLESTKKTSGGLSAGFKKMAVSLGLVAVAAKVFSAVKDFIKGSTVAFQVQEQAVADNVAVFGDYSKEIQQVAADVQSLTTVGDEQFIKLATQAGNFGIAAEEVNESVKGSIGLAEKFKTAGLSHETALKGIALAYAGNFSQLERYIPSLRDAETEVEKMAILQKEMADGFGLAEKAALTSGGQLKQMENDMGDLQEQIGAKLMPSVLAFKKGLLDIAGAILSVAEVKLSEELQNEQIEVNKLTLALSDSNTSIEDRVVLLEQLKAINPDIVAGLDAENLSYEQLTENTKKYNEQIVEKIRLELLNEEQTEIATDLAKKQIKVADRRLEVLENINKISPEIALSQGTMNEKIERAIQLEQDKIDLGKLSVTQYWEAADKISELNFSLLRYNNQLEKENLLQKDVDAANLRISKQKEMVTQTDLLTTSVEELNEAHINSGPLGPTIPETLGSDEPDYTSAQIKAYKEKKDAYQKIDEEFRTKQAVDNALYKEGYEKSEEDMTWFKKSQLAERMVFELMNNDLLTDAEINKIEKDLIILEEELETRKTKILENDIEIKDGKVIIAKELEDELTEAQRIANENKKLQIEQDALDEIEARKVVSNELLKIASGAIDIISKLQDAARNKELNKLDANYKRQLKAAGDDEEAKIKIKEDYEKRRDAIDAEADRKKKKLALAQIAVDVASGIVKIWSVDGVNPILAGIETALLVGVGIAQAAAINSSLAGGGLAKGPLHAQGGIPYGGNEIEGNEYIVNRASTAAFFPLIDAINSAGNSQGRTQDVSGVDIIDYDKLSSLINDKKVYVTTKDLNESLDEDADLKVQNTL